MSAHEIIGLAAALIVMLIGLAGCFIPALPSTPIVLAAAVGHWAYFRPNSIGVWTLILLVLIALFSLVLDYLAGVLGAKKMGATWKGMTGAILGAIVGVFFSLPGLILGPFIGALVFEMIGGREFEPAAKAGFGAVIGVFVGAVGKLVCCVVMIVLFVAGVLSSAGGNGP